MKDQIRLALLSQAPGVGGGEKVTLPALAACRSLDVTVLAHEAVCRYSESLGLKSVTLELPWIRSFGGLPSLALGSRNLKKLTNQMGVQLLYANGSRAMTYALASRIIGGPPLIAHHHGFFTQGPARFLTWGLERWSLAILAPSNAVASVFRSKEKVHVIPNGIDIARFSPPIDKAAAKQVMGLDPGLPVVGMVSRADPSKGMMDFLRVAKDISTKRSDVNFLLVGGALFPHEEVFFFRVKAEMDRMTAPVFLTGVLRDPVPAYQAMDLFLHLSDPEGFPTTVIEAMSAGVPAIAYGWGGVTEIIDDAKTGYLIRPTDVSAVTASVLRVLGDRDSIGSLSQAARVDATERFDLSRFSENLERAILATMS